MNPFSGYDHWLNAFLFVFFFCCVFFFVFCGGACIFGFCLHTHTHSLSCHVLYRNSNPITQEIESIMKVSRREIRRWEFDVFVALRFDLSCDVEDLEPHLSRIFQQLDKLPQVRFCLFYYSAALILFSFSNTHMSLAHISFLLFTGTPPFSFPFL